MFISLVFGVNSIYSDVVSQVSIGSLSDVNMQALTWFILFVAAIGVVLVLYGANYYNPVVGWVGVSMFAVSVVALLALYVHRELSKSD